MKKTIIEFIDFTFQYRAQTSPTLNSINLTIYQGEKVLIVGPSGSGKSTLAQCINGLIPFFYQGKISGSLKIKSKETKDLSIFQLSKHVGTVLQDTDGQFVGLTVAEDIAFQLENQCIPQKEMVKRVEKASKMVDIYNLLDSSPQELSGGQKQRVSVAGVIVEDVDILIFDEPLANLDPAAGKNTMELIENLHKESNKTIIIIEHRLEDVLNCAVDRIIVVNEGKILADMPPRELLSKNILSSIGIREPLYITALRYANVEINEKINPEKIEMLNMEVCRKPLLDWYENTKEYPKNSSSAVLFELKDICFSYDVDKKILHDISLKINKGEMLSFVGKNGAGKSTLAKLICGFNKPNSGKMFLNGEDMSKFSIKQRAEHIGFVMQNPNQMISKIMIFEEVALGLKVRGISEEEINERVNDTLKICGLYEYRNWPISALSFGQKKRVTIASIIALNPEIIILDEPTAGQDFKHYNEIMEFLLKLNKAGTTIIMITHDMHLMLEYTKRAVVFSGGNKLADDSSVNILTNRDIINAANLKNTSLFQLGEKIGLENPRDFVKKFIDYDRSLRNI